MRCVPARWLAALRRRKRAILGALLPAFALAAVSAPACAANLLAARSAPTAAVEHEHGPSAHRSHSSSLDGDSPSAPTFCPHCPLASGAADATHGGCAVADEQDDGRGPSPSERTLAVLAPSVLLPAAHAAPPPLRPAAAARAPPLPSVPLNIRHCVLVI